MGERALAEVFHPAEFICDELEARGWTTWRLIQEGGGSPVDGLALDLYLCVQDVDCRIGDLADVLARGFDVSADLFRNLEKAWRENENRSCDFEPPQWIFADSPAFATPPHTEPPQ